MSSVANTPAPIIDTHAHLDDPAFDADRGEVLAAARNVGVEAFINIAYSPASWRTSARLREQHADVHLAAGLHPGHAHELANLSIEALQESVLQLSPVAIGETGYDFFRPTPSMQEQTTAFRAQLQLAQHMDLPVIIHQRLAAAALMAELDRWPGVDVVALHSFDGDARLVDWAVERSCFIGVGGLATRAKSEELRALLARVSPERLLMETDSPYLPPRGVAERRNTPANLPRIAELLAPIWDLTADDFCRLTTKNARAAFMLKPSSTLVPEETR